MSETWTHAMVTAHRRLPKGSEQWLRPAVAERLIRVRDEFGTEDVISGMAIGGDMLFADEALALGFPLTAAVPFPRQAADEYGGNWTRRQKQHWQQLCDQATQVTLVSETDPATYSQRVAMLHARNDWMLARSQVVFAIWAPANRRGGTYSCIVKAVNAGKPVILFNLATQAVTRPRPQAWAAYGIPGANAVRSDSYA
jgi:uncharacterized phage-like protein YoqJ